MNKKEKKIKYPTFTVRMNKETINLLKKKKLESGKSWNLFIYNLLKRNV